MASEKRLIDANALFRAINRIKCPQGACMQDGIADACQAVMEAPTVDAVEVVRCKDCKHYDNSEGICWCHLNSKFYPGGFDWHGFPEDGFCSYGERKDHEASQD